MRRENMRVAFYKAKYGGWDDKFINRFSGNDGYSHCELVINAQTMVGAHMLTGGVREFHYVDVYASKKWDIVEIPIGTQKAKEYAYSMIGTPYDTIGVPLWFIGLDLGDSEDKVWCSEFNALCVNRELHNKAIEETRIMPNELYKALIRDFSGRHIETTNAIKEGDIRDIILLDKYDRILNRG